MHMEAKHGKRVMTSITLKITMTPEELQNVLLNLENVEQKSTSTWSVVTKAFIAAMTNAAKPRTGGDRPQVAA